MTQVRASRSAPSPSTTRRGPGRPPATGGPPTTHLILEAARDVFGELGYERTTITEIAERAGVTRPAVNHYYRGKHCLYEAVVASTAVPTGADTTDGTTAGGSGEDHGTDRADHDAEEGTGGSGDTAATREPVPQRLGHLVHAATRGGAENPSYARFLTSAVLDAFRAPEVADRTLLPLDEIRTLARQTLAEGVRTGELRPDLDVAAVTEMLIAVTWGMTLYAGFVGSHDQIEAVVEQFGRLLEGGLW